MKLIIMIIILSFSVKGMAFSNHYKKNDKVKCILPLVNSWSNGQQDFISMLINCKVLKVYNGFKKTDYQILRVDCTKDIEKHSTTKAGVGLVKGHKLNKGKKWVHSDNCHVGVLDD